MLGRNLRVFAVGVPGTFRRSDLTFFSLRMSFSASDKLSSPDALSLNVAPTKTVPEGFSSVSEGSASIIHESGHVFYNPAQVQNRDLSIACLNVFSKIYRKEKEARVAKRCSRTADACASSLSSPVFGDGVVASHEAVEYKGLRILEGLLV